MSMRTVFGTKTKWARDFFFSPVVLMILNVWMCRMDSWNLLRNLAYVSELPWYCAGDFNDLLSSSEKKGLVA